MEKSSIYYRSWLAFEQVEQSPKVCRTFQYGYTIHVGLGSKRVSQVSGGQVSQRYILLDVYRKTYNSVDFYSRVLYETVAIDLPQKQANNLPDCFPEYTLRCNSFLIRISRIKTFIRATTK